ncbi:uncharacterized protein [Salminus brasiliensis]|uniref:uncharacterized protein n=1 Tax=Salminus brasiliensis TaxID=930266 RepID=UPI003B82F70D
MSQPRTRSPLYSRNSTLPGRQADGFYDAQFSSQHSEPWRNPENVNKLEGNSHWDNGPSQGEEEVDHWAKFIEAIGHAGRRRASPTLRYHTQDDVQRSEDKPSHSPRRLPRERLSSPKASHYGAETRRRIASPGRRRNEHNATHFDKHTSNRTDWNSRDSSPRHLQGKRHNRMEHGYHNEEHEDRYQERSSFSERSIKPNYREHHLHPKRFKGLDPEEEYSVSHRGFSPHNAPVIVEHAHGISNHNAISRGPPRSHDPYRNRDHSKSRDPPRSHDPLGHQEHPRSHDPLRNREHPRSRAPPRVNDFARNRNPVRISDLTRNRDGPRSDEPPHGRDPPRTREPSRSRESFKHERDLEQYAGVTHDRYGGSANYHVGEEARFHRSSVGRGNPMRGRSQHREPSRIDPHAREHHGQRTVGQTSDVDLRNDKGNRARASVHAWDKGTQRGENHVLERGKVSKGIPQHRKPNTSAAPASRMDFTEHETLRIKVDMSRPVGHSSHLGYSSERQLSLDLVNVGRQRLDFLPMLEHSGTYRESAMHSGTFAQEIITLVHHVKESFFQGQGITLDERFSSEQHYSLVDEDGFDDENELEEMEPVINRPLGGSSSDTQIFCNIGSFQPHKRHVPAPGDLRHDLERRRQQRLQGVKITIAGGNFSQMALQSQENEPVYVDEDDVPGAEDDLGWSEQQSEQQNGQFQEMPGSSFSARQNFNHFHNTQSRPRRRRNPNGPSW